MKLNNSDLQLAQTIATAYYGSEVEIEQLTQQNNAVFRLRFQDNCKLAKNQGNISLSKEYTIIKLLHQHKIPVPVIEHEDSTGNTLGRPFLIMDSAGEENAITTVQQASSPANSLFTQMGSLLAQIHQIQFSQSGDIYSDGIKPRDGQKWLERQYHRADGLVQQNLLTHEEVALFKSVPMPDIKGFSLCHGDFHGVQCIVKQGQITAIVDWESAWIGNPSVDLAMTHAYLDCYCPVELTRCFFNGYLSVTPLPADYVQANLPIRMAQILGLLNTWYQADFPEGMKQALKMYRIYTKQYE